MYAAKLSTEINNALLHCVDCVRVELQILSSNHHTRQTTKKSEHAVALRNKINWNRRCTALQLRFVLGRIDNICQLLLNFGRVDNS